MSAREKEVFDSSQTVCNQVDFLKARVRPVVVVSDIIA
jgi:hypothetical protein